MSLDTPIDEGDGYVCNRCHTPYVCAPGKEHTDLCSECAYARVDELEAELAEMRARLDRYQEDRSKMAHALRREIDTWRTACRAVGGETDTEIRQNVAAFLGQVRTVIRAQSHTPLERQKNEMARHEAAVLLAESVDALMRSLAAYRAAPGAKATP
jgi:hypothetical protein